MVALDIWMSARRVAGYRWLPDVRAGHLRWTCALFVSAGLAMVAFVVPAAAAQPPPVVVEYQGTIDETKPLAGGTNNWNFHVQWDFVWDLHPPLAQPAWRIKTLTGTISAILAPPNESASCSGKLSDNPRMPALSYQYIPAFETVAGSENVVVVQGNAPNVLLSSSPQTPFGFCGNSQNEAHWDRPFPQPHPDPTQPRIDYRLDTGTVSQPFKQDWTSTDGANVHFVLDSTLVVNGTAPPLPATPKAVRDAALAAMRAELGQSFYHCVTATAGTILFALGIFSGGAIGVVAGGTMLAVAGPACSRAIAVLVNLQRTYRDPPLPDYRTVARIVRRRPPRIAFPSCSGHGARIATACRQLHATALAWVTAIQRVQESSQALATTIGRESAARAAHAANAEAIQRQTALTLLPTLRNDLRGQAAAGSKLAALLRHFGVSARLTRVQSKAAIDDVLRRMGRRGVTRVQLEAEAARQLTPRPLNLLIVLAQRLG